VQGGRVLSLIFLVGARGVGQLFIQGLAVAEAAAQKGRPLGHGGGGGGLLGEQGPKGGLVPAEVLTRAVAVGADGLAQTGDFRDELFAGHGGQVSIHTMAEA
jgi:hypothetical protein